MSITDTLRQHFQQFVENNIVCEIKPHWNDDRFHPTVNYVAEQTGWHPAWIDQKLSENLDRHLRETGSQETLDDVTPRTIINYLRSLPNESASVSASTSTAKLEHSI